MELEYKSDYITEYSSEEEDFSYLLHIRSPSPPTTRSKKKKYLIKIIFYIYLLYLLYKL